ncbi:MAG: lamin tail domain-containing protein [Deltaproteobacteria bacterium]|nr:lamin tail domain-containing protein [Deltaproteobacteria bacterium]
MLEPGELVISELRGDQEGDDSFGHYIELYNAAARSVDLQGVRVRARGASGDVIEFFVRDELEIPAGAHVVLGPGVPDEPAMWIDYAVGWDITNSPDPDKYPRTLLAEASGIIEVESCGELIDEVVYAGLPSAGTFACGSVDAPPDALANDDTNTGCWCVDAAEADPDFPLFGLGLPGTPGRANRCAP